MQLHQFNESFRVMRIVLDKEYPIGILWIHGRDLKIPELNCLL